MVVRILGEWKRRLSKPFKKHPILGPGQPNPGPGRRKVTSAITTSEWESQKNNKETKMNSYNFYLLKNQRYLRRDSVLRLFQEPRRELPITLLNLWPLRIPRFLRPAAVKPRSSRCLWTGLQIQLILGSRRTALWKGSTIITSKYLYVESWATQYELSTRKLPQ